MTFLCNRVAVRVTFKRVSTVKLWALFTNNGNARSGVTEMEVWRE